MRRRKPKPKAQCNATVFRTQKTGCRCSNGAWWPGGWCHLHVKALGPSFSGTYIMSEADKFAAWLGGIATGAEARTLPGLVQIAAMYRWTHRLVGHTTQRIVAWSPDDHAYGDARDLDTDACWREWPAKIVLRMGPLSLSAKPGAPWSEKPPFRMAVTPADAAVAIDRLLSKNDSIAAELVAVQVTAAIERASILDEATASRLSADLVLAQRVNLGTYSSLPYWRGNMRQFYG
jgi:hypothetical protein